ncbi:MAG: maleylpyruvate isomerase N-terminal domain-containing protein [Candidatus Limnocylindria bacterium]|nr:maleylpyruvate isomerase N-terminal domain-containing protein [Candidatus Limnocylindria bacterium]
MNPRAKADALAAFDQEWRDLDAFFRRLPESDLERPVFTGEGPGWRVRDLIPHLAAWQERAARAARKVAAEGVQPGPEDRVRTFLGIAESVDELNDATFSGWRARTVADLLSELESRHAELMNALASLTPPQLMSGESPDDVYVCFRMPGLQHLRIHRAHLEAACTKEGTT